MASTYTTNLRLEKPGYNEKSDTWGTTTNTDWDRVDGTLGGAIYGLTLSTAGSSATFGIAAGGASGMTLSSAYTKTTSSWAVGTGNGALDTGSIANSTWYHVWLIERTDTGVVDILISTSATSPALPTNYDRKRRIGAMKTNGSAQWTKFFQYGDLFLWDVMVKDADSSFSSSSAVLFTLSVPTGVQVQAKCSIQLDYNAANDTILFSCPDQTDTTPSSSVQFFQVSTGNTAARQVIPFDMMTDTSARIRGRASTGSSFYRIYTYAWVDTRGQ